MKDRIEEEKGEKRKEEKSKLKQRTKQGIWALAAMLLPILRKLMLNTWLIAFPEDHLRYSKELHYLKTKKEEKKEKEKGVKKKKRILRLHTWLRGYDNAAPLCFEDAGRQAGRHRSL